MDAKHLIRRIFPRRRGGQDEQQRPALAADRRGSALVLTLVITLSLAGLATSAVYLGSNASLVATAYDQERDMRYAAEAMLQMGKSTLNFDPYASPDTGYRAVMQDVPVMGADGQPIPGVTGTMYLGPTSSNTGQYGRFVSVVAVVKNTAGAQVIRRLELAQESFAKYAYWSNQESNNGQTIYFNNNDQLWGPVWSNDVINIGPGGARFHDGVATAQDINGAGYGTFDKGYSAHQKPITLPNNTTLTALPGYASSGNFNFTAPNSGAVSQAMMRVEFVARDLNGNGAINGADEGFVRVYVANASAGPGWLRGDPTMDNCGASYVFKNGVPPLFVPLSEHQHAWMTQALQNAPVVYPVAQLTSSDTATMVAAVMSQPSARCYLGGDPNLRAVELRGTLGYVDDTIKGALNRNQGTRAALDLGGTDTTFVAGSPGWGPGYWMQWGGTIDPRLQSNWPGDAQYLFPLYRGLNRGTKGVIYVNGTTGISGTLRGRVTIYVTGNVAILDDLKYATDPSLNLCTDVLGVISGNNILIADNALQDPVYVGGVGYRNMDDTKDVFVQGVLMALNTAFGAENYTSGPNNANGCEGLPNGRGCLYLTGGIIQQQRGAVGLSDGTGFTKRYSYDRCALYNPPPYFPTTGRYTDNRYYEVDPNGFDVAALYHALTPGP